MGRKKNFRAKPTPPSRSIDLIVPGVIRALECIEGYSSKEEVLGTDISRLAFMQSVIHIGEELTFVRDSSAPFLTRIKEVECEGYLDDEGNKTSLVRAFTWWRNTFLHEQLYNRYTPQKEAVEADFSEQVEIILKNIPLIRSEIEDLANIKSETITKQWRKGGLHNQEKNPMNAADFLHCARGEIQRLLNILNALNINDRDSLRSSLIANQQKGKGRLGLSLKLLFVNFSQAMKDYLYRLEHDTKSDVELNENSILQILSQADQGEGKTIEELTAIESEKSSLVEKMKVIKEGHDSFFDPLQNQSRSPENQRYTQEISHFLYGFNDFRNRVVHMKGASSDYTDEMISMLLLLPKIEQLYFSTMTELFHQQAITSLRITEFNAASSSSSSSSSSRLPDGSCGGGDPSGTLQVQEPEKRGHAWIEKGKERAPDTLEAFEGEAPAANKLQRRGSKNNEETEEESNAVQKAATPKGM